MAEKSFGVKEINLIGASGTPTIDSPNNLNLNAVNVAISTNVSIGGTLSVTGNVSVGGTLTYEDVTNIDVVGIATFRDDVKINEDKELTFDGADGGKIYADGSNFLVEGTNQGGATYIRGGSALILSGGNTSSHQTTIYLDKPGGNGRCRLYYGGNSKLETTSTGINVTGGITVDGSALSIDPSTSDIQGMWTISGGTSGYTFTGPGQNGSDQNPDIFLVRGQRYRFVNNLGVSHPFEFRNFDNNADYTDGITGSQSGTQDFNVQHDAPSALKYRCTIHQNSMLGNIYIIGGKRGILTSSSTLSGGSNSFNGIPSWATKITVVFYQMSTDTTSARALVRLRNSNGSIASGYDSYSVDEDGSDSSNDIQNSTGFVIETQSSGHTYNGTMIIEKIDNTKYVSSYSAVRTATGALGTYQQISGNGRLSIASGGIVTGVSLVTTAGSFDSTPSTNYITIYYE